MYLHTGNVGREIWGRVTAAPSARGDVPLEGVVVRLQALLDRLVVAVEARVLNVLGEAAQRVDVLLGEVVELPVRLRRRL